MRPHVKKAYEEKAEEVRHLRRLEIGEQMKELEAQILVLKQRREETLGLFEPLIMSSARLSATQKLQLEDLYGDQKRYSAWVTEMRARVAQQIMPPSEHFRKVLDQMPIYTRPRGGRPS